MTDDRTGNRPNQSVALIGIGFMGKGIATSLLKKGRSLWLLEGRARESLKQLSASGAKIANDIGSLCNEVRRIILCLPSSAEVEAVCRGDHGLLNAALPGTIILDCSTSHPGSTLQLHKEFSDRGVFFFDAPLTRTPREAAEGRLNCILGGGEEAGAAVAVLSDFCENIFRAGPVGSGHLLKLLNNGLSLGMAALAGEVIRAAIALNADLHILRRIVSGGGANSAPFQGIMEWLLEDDRAALLFSLSNGLKDLDYLHGIAKEEGIDLRILSSISDEYGNALARFGENATLPMLCGHQAGAAKTVNPSIP